MKVAVYSSKDYDRKYLAAANDALPSKERHDLSFFETRLDETTAGLAQGYDVVCIFVNDDVNAAVVDKLADQGTTLLALRSAGFNNVAIDQVVKRKLTLTHVPAYSPHAVAEHALALLLTLNRKTHKVYNRVREGNFSLEGVGPGFDLNGKTVGVLGTGKIGECFVRIMMGLGCRVLGYDLKKNPALLKLEQKQEEPMMGSGSFEYREFDDVLQASAILSLHLPLNPHTHGLINQENLAKMKKGVILLNTSRGALVDSKAVIHALKSKHIGAIGLDTYEEEEDLFYSDFSEEIVTDDQLIRLMTFPNVLITPHQGFYTHEALTEIAETTLRGVVDFTRDKEPANCLVYKGEVAPGISHA